jgi:hypothetical protein
MLDPSWLESHSLGKCNHMTRLLFLGMISLADDEGRLRGNPVYLGRVIFPYDDIPTADIVEGLRLLWSYACITFYKVDGECYIFLPKWKTYQRVDHPSDSTLPGPEKGVECSPVSFQNDSRMIREPFENDSRMIRGNELINKSINITKGIRESVDLVYSKYPSRCPVRLASLGKCSKNKDKIKAILKTGASPDELIKAIELYTADCIRHKNYMKNFATFLNNLPDLKEFVKAPEPLREDDIDYFNRQGNACSVVKPEVEKPMTDEERRQADEKAAELANKFKTK